MSVYNECEDAGLWTLFLEGDKHSLEIIYLRHYDLLLNYGLKYNIGEHLVKDCIQDLFVKLYSGKNLKTTRYVRSYLIKSLRNLILDKISVKKTEQVLDNSDFDIFVNDSALENLFSKNDEDLQVSRKLMKAYSHLSFNQKKIIYLRHIKDMSYKEIADFLGINEQSSMNLYSRTLLKIRKLMLNIKFLFIFI